MNTVPCTVKNPSASSFLIEERFNLSDVVEDDFSLGDLPALDSEEVDAFERARGFPVVLSRQT